MLYACAAPGGQATDSPNSTAVHGYAAKVPKKNIQGHTGPHIHLMGRLPIREKECLPAASCCQQSLQPPV